MVGDVRCRGVGAGHWRTRDGDEVDLVLERDDGAILAFEVKATTRVPGEDFKPLRKLRAAAGDAFLAGIVLYTGTRSHNFEDRLFALPVDRLWSRWEGGPGAPIKPRRPRPGRD